MGALKFSRDYIFQKKSELSGDIKKAGYNINGQWTVVDAQAILSYDNAPIEVKFMIENRTNQMVDVTQIRLYYSPDEDVVGYEPFAEMDVDIQGIEAGSSLLYNIKIDLFSVEYNDQKTGMYDRIGG